MTDAVKKALDARDRVDALEAELRQARSDARFLWDILSDEGKREFARIMRTR